MLSPLTFFSLVAAVVVAGYLIAKPTQRQVLLKRLKLLNHRSVPSPNSPEKDVLDKQAERSKFNETFPPQRREALVALLDRLPKSFQEESPTELEKPRRGRMVPNDVAYSELKGDWVTPTGFTVDEIKRLGDFPDYATLSGIPLPPAYTNFDINTALPRPYRPFRWPYHQTMSLTKLDTDWWLELFKGYAETIRQRKELYAKHGGLVLQHLPGSEMACKELMEMVLEFLAARYPHCFTLDKQRGVFHNKILGAQTDIAAADHPFSVLLDNIPEDFGVMIQNPDDGRYYLRAGLICSALGWNVDVKIGKPLAGIHEPIPDYKEKMQFSMDRFFAKMPTDKPIQRGSWGLEIDEPLFMPPGDPHEQYREYQLPSLTLERVHLRVDWQTLRRLPLTGAVVFNFKGIFTPLAAFRDEPYVPALVLRNLDQAKPSIMQYKNTWHVEHVAKPALRRWVEEQEEAGWVEPGWEPRTLDDAPMYPGWEDKWSKQQGFAP